MRFGALLLLSLAVGVFAGTARAETGTGTYAPTVVTDKADYAPASLVTITGSGWPANELLQVYTNDSVGNTWSDTGYPETDASGGFVYTVTLPSYFVAQYTTVVSDTNGLSATVSFTDASINMDSAPHDPTNSTSASFSWHVTGGGGLTQCKLDSGTYAPCSGSKSYTGLSEGSHSFFVQFTDGSGTRQTDWYVDLTPPDTAIVTKPAASTTSTSASFTYSGSDSHTTSPGQFTFECSLDGGAFASCAKAGTTYSSLGFGGHTFDVRSIDEAGNADTSPAHFAWTIVSPDSTPPVITKVITGTAGSNGWYTSDVSVAWTVTDPDSAVVIDSGCGTQNLTSETTGTTSSCTAHSAGGSASDSVTLKIDKTGPSAALAVTAGTPGANGWYTSDVTVSTSGSDGVSGGVTCTADQFQTAETSGTVFNGSCTNAAGLKTVAAPLTVKLDKTGPSAALAVTAGTAGTNGWYTSDVTVSTSGSDGVSGGVTCTADQFQTAETSGAVFNGSCTNAAGLKVDAAPLTVKLDKTGPSAALSVTSGTLGDNGWYTSDVTVGTSGTDSISGPTTCTPDQHQTTDTAGHDFHGSCTNDAGLTTVAATLTLKRDATAPTIEDLGPTVTPDGDNGWYVHAVTNEFRASDGVSGLSSDCLTAFPSDGSGDRVRGVSTGVQEGAAVKVSSGICTDQAGNVAAAVDSAPLKIDRTAPTIEDLGPTVTPDGDNGWYVHAVTNEFKASDGVSGLSNGCLTAFPSDGSGDRVRGVSTGVQEGATVTVSSGTCTDEAGNQAAGIGSAAFMVDLTAPTIVRHAAADSCDVPGDSGWCRGTQTAGFTAADAVSGLATDGAASRDFTRTSAANGSNVSIGSGAVSDVAGNTNPGIDATGFKIDSVAPSVSGAPTTSPNAAGWYNGDVTIAWTCGDDTSGVVSCPSNSTISGEGRNLTVNSGVVSDKAGNSASADSSPAVKIDRTAPNAPTAAATSGPNYVDADGHNWWMDAVTVGFTANGDPDLADNSPGSGVDLSTLSATKTFTTQGPNTASGTVDDHAGNESAAGSLDVYVDNAAPTLGACPAAGPFILGSGDHSIGPISASDTGGSGVDAGASTLTGVVNSDTVGTKTVTFTAYDHVGHGPVTKSCQYTVIYNWTGFFQPVDNLPGLNKAKAGSAIPVKFNLGGNQGLGIFLAGYPTVSGPLSCGNTATADLVEETVTAGASSLTYDTTASQYVYVWKTQTSYASSCRTLTLKLLDGTVHQANFWFTK